MSDALLLLPDFALIAVGWLICRYTPLNRPVWDGAERLVYYVLFPALLFSAILRNPLQLGSALPLAGAGLVVVAAGIGLAYALGRLPGVDALGTLAAALSPGRLAGWLAGRLPTLRQHQAALFGTGRQARLAASSRWLVLAVSQDMALAFNIAAAITALALVVFSDLAFGWATTLDASDTGFHALLQVLAAPWGPLWPTAVPDAELVAASRYFRAEELATDAAMLTRWWPFVLACMLVYGVLPRLLAALLAHWRLRRAIGATLLALPEVQALLHRMRGPLVESRASDAVEFRDEAGDGARSSEPVELPAPVRIIDWGDLPIATERLAALLGERLGFAAQNVLGAGGNRSLADDEATARGCAGAGSVLVACKAWEPPLLDLQDFLRSLRAAVGADTTIVVVPVSLDEQRLVAPGSRDREQWRAACASTDDAALHLLLDVSGVTP